MTDARRPALGFLAFGILGVLVPIVITDWSLESGFFNFALSLLVLEISAGRLALLIAAGEPRMLWLGVHLFVYPFLGVAALAQTTTRQYPLLGTNAYPLELISTSLAVTLLGLVAFEAGAVLSRRRAPADLAASSRPWRFAEGRTVLLALVGLAFVTYVVARTGVTPFLTSRTDATQALAGGITDQAYNLENKSGFVLQRVGVRMPVFVALLAIVASIRAGTWRYGVLGRPGTTLLVALLLGANLLVNNPIANSRFWFGLVLLGTLGVFLPWRRPHGFRILAASALGVLVLAFALLDYFRRTEAVVTAYSPRENYLSDGSYSAFQTIMNGHAYLADHAHTGGFQLLTALGTYVPRTLWPAKGPDTGYIIDPLYNRSASLWTEFEVDFGVAGVVVGFVLLGVAISRLETRLLSREVAFALLLPLLSGVIIFVLRGSLVPAMGTIYPLVAIYFFTLTRQPSHAGPADQSVRQREHVTVAE